MNIDKSECYFTLLKKGLRRILYWINSLGLFLEVRSLGSKSKVLGGVIISGGRNIRIGERCFLGRNVILDARNGKINIGNNVEIRDGARIYGTDISIGDDVTIGENSSLIGNIHIKNNAWIARNCDLSGNVYIGNAILGPKVSFSGSEGHQRDPDTDRILMTKSALQSQKETNSSEIAIYVEDGAWIGSGVVVPKGVRIAENSVVGAGSIVTKDTSYGSVVAGNPSKEIKSRLSRTK